ncbi:MAG: tetratricopeptide repeat protein [Candidatus Omnitrophota bacterium]
MQKQINAIKMGQRYLYGDDGYKKNYKKAFKYLMIGANASNAECQNDIGYCYDMGFGVKKNLKRAIEWYLKAAAKRDKVALCNLGIAYEFGNGVSINYKKAFQFYRKSATLEHADAQCNLGTMYLDGLGTKQNLREGIKWIRKAALNGDSKAQYNLGMAYLDGEGVKIDKQVALGWLKRAARQGHIKARRRIGVILRKRNREIKGHSTKAGEGMNDRAKEINFSELLPISKMKGDGREDTARLKEMHKEAVNYITSFSWCKKIEEKYFGLGVGDIIGIYLFKIQPSKSDINKWVWVVVGDLPPAYLVVDRSPDPASALNSYIREMDEWVQAVKKGKPVDGLIPVNAPPTAENAKLLKTRLKFLKKEILPYS